MAELGKDSRYRALATAAASILGSSSSSIIAAILAQWTCEQPGGPPWPPVHNNPGFVTIGALRSNGIPLGAYATTSPGVHFLAVFSSPSEGATAYAELLRRGKRWAPARAAIAQGDGAGFLKAVTSAGYGTRYSCAISAFKRLGGSVPAGGSMPPGDATNAAFDATNSADFAKWQAALASIDVPNDPGHVITHDEAVRIVDILYKGQIPSSSRDSTIASFEGKTVREAAGPAGVNFGGNIDPFGPVADAIAGLGGALGEGVFVLLIGGVIAALFVLGAWKTMSGPSVTIMKRVLT